MDRHTHGAVLDWWDPAEVGLRLALLRNGVVDYFPCPAGIPRATETSRLWPPSALLRPLGFGSIVPGLFDPIKAAMGAAEMNLQGRPAWRSLATSPTVKTLVEAEDSAHNLIWSR